MSENKKYYKITNIDYNLRTVCIIETKDKDYMTEEEFIDLIKMCTISQLLNI